MFKIGNSIDYHNYKLGRDLILGGIKIPYEFGLDGDSDADSLLHAISEAMLGALSLGDLGTYYNKNNALNLDSKIILKECYQKVLDKGYKISNIDTMILIEKPSLKPYKELIKKNIASILTIDEDQISIKATTMEGKGIIGNKEGVLAMATVLLEEAK